VSRTASSICVPHRCRIHRRVASVATSRPGGYRANRPMGSSRLRAAIAYRSRHRRGWPTAWPLNRSFSWVCAGWRSPSRGRGRARDVRGRGRRPGATRSHPP
jgi:hypothetical protein